MIKKLKNKAVQFSLGLLPVFCLTACGPDSINSIGLGNYKTETYVIDDLECQSQPLSKDQYSIDRVCSLSYPDGLLKIYPDWFVVKNDRIYTLEQYKFYVFDLKGKLLYQAGEAVGRNSFVDNEGNIHTFHESLQKIFVYNSKGEVSKVLYTEKEFDSPNLMGLTNNGRYMFEFIRNTNGYALTICDKSNRFQRGLIPFEKEHAWMGISRFFQNEGRLSHIPQHSDSVLVFRNDTLEKVVRVDFKGQDIMHKNPEALEHIGKTDEVHDSTNILGISEYQETESFKYFHYVYKNRIQRRLIKKSTNEILSGSNFFEGFDILFNNSFYLSGNQLIAIVNEENVERVRNAKRDDVWMDNYNKSAPQVQALIDGKIKTPALFYISFK